MENEILINIPALSFKEWMETLGFNENTIQSRLSNLAKLEACYGPLLDLWKKDRFKSLLEELSYSVEDGRNNVSPAAKIPISGNVYEGLATYRSTLRLYARYLQYLQNLSGHPFGRVGKAVYDAISEIKEGLGDQGCFSQKEVKERIVGPLVATLNQSLQGDGYTFEAEKTISNLPDSVATAKDRYDIVGRCAANADLPTVIIEVDTHRSDQISKKVVSRVSLNTGSKLYYVALVYPNKHVSREAEMKECAKYFLYIDALFNELRPPEKRFKGFTLY